MPELKVEIVEMRDEPEPYRVEVRDGEQLLHAKSFSSRAEAESVVLIITAGDRSADGAHGGRVAREADDV